MIRQRDLEAAKNEIAARMITEVSQLKSMIKNRHRKDDPYFDKENNLRLALFQVRLVRKLRALNEGLYCLEYEKFKVER